MTTTATAAHAHTELIVCGGIVRCADCLEFFPEHKDSRHVPGLIARNQER